MNHQQKTINTFYSPPSGELVGAYAFGMPMPGRSYTNENYRFGFNGMENANDIAPGNYTTPFREIDTRLGGRWWSTDPIVKPWESPYAGFSNNPIHFADPSGLDPESDNSNDDQHLDDKGNKMNVNIDEVTVTPQNNSENPFSYNEVENPSRPAGVPSYYIKGCNGDCGPSNDYFDVGFLRMMKENFSIDAEYSIEMGVGEADITRVLGYERNDNGGSKVFYGAKVFSLSNNNESPYYKFDASPYLTIKGTSKQYEGHLKLQYSLVNKDITGEVGGSYYGIYLKTGGMIYNFKTREYTSDGYLNTGFSLLDISKKSPFRKNGLDVVHNVEISVNFRLYHFLKEWFK